MFIFIKKQYLCNAVFSIALAVSMISLWSRGGEAPVAVSALPVSDICIVIDAGHGGRDGGAVGESGIPEREINLALSKALGNLFIQSGARVVYTRETDGAIVDETKQNGTTIKQRDMSLRREIRDNSSADIFISIHMNKFSDPSCKGAQVFYSSDDESKLLAECISSELGSILSSDNNRAPKDGGDEIYLLRQSAIPSVLIECGFLSNPAEEKMLLDSAYREKTAFAIYSGVLKYFSA